MFACLTGASSSHGTHVSDNDARTLVDLLLRPGFDDDVSAASAIEAALAQHAETVVPLPLSKCASGAESPTPGLFLRRARK